MGMLLTMALILAACSAFLEFKLLKSIPLLGRLNKKSMFFGLALSIALSAGLGAVFGAAGLVVMMAGVISTAMTEPVHAFRRGMESKKAETQARIAKARAAKAEFVQTYRPIGIGLKYLAMGLLAPIWLPVIINRKFQEAKSS
jgi:hypothetical protein